MESHINNYLEWLRKNMKEETLPNGLVEITTPFLDRHNDYTQIYLQKLEDGNYRVTDLGYTVDDLEMCGVDIASGKRNEILHRTLSAVGIKFDDQTKELYAVCSYNQLAETQHALTQCMLDVNDLFYLSSESVSNIFYEDVKNYFEKSKIFYTPDVNIIGRSGLNHHFPFVFQRNAKHPERLVRVANNLTRAEAERFMFVWLDICKMRPESCLLVLVNDKHKITESLLSGMAKFDEKIIPVPWSKRVTQGEIFA